MEEGNTKTQFIEVVEFEWENGETRRTDENVNTGGMSRDQIQRAVEVLKHFGEEDDRCTDFSVVSYKTAG